MTNTSRTLVDWLDDLCVRFIVNLPNEELQSVERICFQIEEAQWFYEDFIRPLDPNNLPSMHLRKFSQLMFQHCPLFSAYSEELHQQAYEQFLAYKTRVPVRGAIMLNEDMTHAVLVKGWKKGAKWSFPRGKINKEETDLDCAVREVWEETGYDLREADLVEPDEHMKKITVTMREQSMMLYVFRGVPMDTYFEPRTRKEISKIDWYKLTDLPTLRRKNQVQQQGNGNDLIKESSFYMVAPFLGPLKQWIKQQHKLGRQRARNGAHMAPAPVAGTDDEDVQPTLYETTADEAAPVADAQVANNFADMVARLGRGHCPSHSYPELSQENHAPPQQSQDPAEALKRLLSVGVQSQPVEAPSQPPPQGNPLLALFKQGSQQPRTPFEQIMPPPIQPSSPHGQHGPRPPQMGSMGPPPPFFPPHQNMPFQGPPGHINGMQPPPPPHMSPHFMHQPPQQQQQQQQQQHMFPSQQLSMQQVFDQHNSRPQFQEIGDSHFAGGNGRPVIPSASKLPAPNLNAHAMGLLNSFKNQNQQPAFPPSPQTIITAPLHRSQQTTPKIQHPMPQHRPHGLVSPPAQFVPSPPQFQSPPISSSFEPQQPKPRNAYQDSLLSMFKSTPPLPSPQPPPAELSALPTTPAHVSAQPVANPSGQPNAALFAVFNAPTKSNMTSATVSGPVNAPDFDTMKRNRQPTNGSSRGSSPPANMPFMPQQILKRAPQASPKPALPAELAGSPQMTFQPQILKRPQQQTKVPGQAAAGETLHKQGLLDMFKGASPQPPPALPAVLPSRSPAPPSLSDMDRRDSVPAEQKTALLSLFGNKPSPSPNPQTHSPVPPARSPFPPTPKTSMSGIISPVSPLAANSIVGATSPEEMTNRSRISSIGDGVPPPSIVIPPHASRTTVVDAGVSLAAAVQNNEGVSLVGLSTNTQQSRTGSTSEGKSPVDKSFLLGFLENVARGGR
ncbi:mRNA-decapping enzyme subunit 2 [Alternaria panax]|uniref:mRNA-decapping enzyme subunit 2 n=1 Tax=Alternaria panax TaxID=48097 RepID=A0AAD4NP14_9PLEO|nr:mRNA-decapping enzyme subunit 2 [Alternaria panax]